MQTLFQDLRYGAQMWRKRYGWAMVVGFTLALGFVLAASAQADSAPASRAPAAGNAALSPAQTPADFDLMRKALEEAHTGLYRYATKSELERVFAAQRAKLNRPLTKTEFLAVVAETLAHIRCGYTGVGPDTETQTLAANARKFPLRVLVEGRRLRVLFNDTPDDRTIQPGMEILAINGRKTGDILQRIWPTLSADGDIETGKRASTGRVFARHYWLLVEPASEFTVQAKDAAGRQVTAQLSGVTDADRTKNQNPVNAAMPASTDKFEWSRDHLSLRFLKEPEIAQIRIRSFGGANYPLWMADTFRTLREKGTRTLILDLRGNGGGNVTAAPFRRRRISARWRITCGAPRSSAKKRAVVTTATIRAGRPS